MINKFRDLPIFLQITLYVLVIFFMIFAGIKIHDLVSPNVLNKDYVFISLEDIEDAYEETGDYVEYMIADHNPEYVFSTIENYMTDKIKENKDLKCIVSGIFYNKNEDKTIYEVAIINATDTDSVEYILIDTDEQKIYDDSQKMIEYDTEMKSKLDEYEQEIIDLQSHYMTKKDDKYVITKQYIDTLINGALDSENYRYLEMICNDDEYFYKVDVNYNNGHSDIILINARTGNMYK